MSQKNNTSRDKINQLIKTRQRVEKRHSSIGPKFINDDDMEAFNNHSQIGLKERIAVTDLVNNNGRNINIIKRKESEKMNIETNRRRKQSIKEEQVKFIKKTPSKEKESNDKIRNRNSTDFDESEIKDKVHNVDGYMSMGDHQNKEIKRVESIQEVFDNRDPNTYGNQSGLLNRDKQYFTQSMLNVSDCCLENVDGKNSLEGILEISKGFFKNKES